METLAALWPISDVPSQCISIYEGPGVFLQQYAAAPPVHQTVFVAYWLQAEVLNGGLAQLFGNDTGVLAPEAVEACMLLNLPNLAGKIQEAMNWFGSPYPRNRLSRHQQLQAAGQSGVDPFEELDEVVAQLIYEEGVGLEAAALALVKARGSVAGDA